MPTYLPESYQSSGMYLLVDLAQRESASQDTSLRTSALRRQKSLGKDEMMRQQQDRKSTTRLATEPAGNDSFEQPQRAIGSQEINRRSIMYSPRSLRVSLTRQSPYKQRRSVQGDEIFQLIATQTRSQLIDNNWLRSFKKRSEEAVIDDTSTSSRF
jgi:hypothetical protein